MQCSSFLEQIYRMNDRPVGCSAFKVALPAMERKVCRDVLGRDSEQEGRTGHVCGPAFCAI
eukprot:9273739-Pyramimonas_sp.AAC.2